MCLSLFSSKQCILYIVIHCMLHIVLKKIMTNTRLQIRFGFRVILNNQGLGRCYQPQPSAGLITHTSTLIIPHIIRKTSSNNCLVWSKGWCIGESPSPPTNVARFQILASTPWVGWVCSWFSPLLQEIFLQLHVLRFSPLPKNHHFQIPLRAGKADKELLCRWKSKVCKLSKSWCIACAVRAKKKTFRLVHVHLCYRSNLISS